MMSLPDLYRYYIACLNSRRLDNLHLFVDEEVVYNNRKIGLSGYTKMLEQNFTEIPDLQFELQLLIYEKEYIASRLIFDCTPKEIFLGIPVNGRNIVFTENVFYQFHDRKIKEVWSIIDKAAIEAQLKGDK
jgi:predicted ester cyclase